MDLNRCSWRVRTADSTGLWRKRVGVEPTTLAAKDRINGFEGHEGHRTPFASDQRTQFDRIAARNYISTLAALVIPNPAPTVRSGLSVRDLLPRSASGMT